MSRTPTWTDIWIALDLHVLDGFDQDQTVADVTQSLRNFMAFDNLDLGQDIHIGEIYRYAMRVEGVDWVDITALNDSAFESTVVENVDVPFGSIARIAPDTGEDTPLVTTDDTTGLTITAYGGTISGS